jgi:ACS family hexuronate transporter-like MFS transporter
MFPGNAVGSIVGIGGMAGSVGGVLLSLAAGRILQLTHSYTPLFALAGSVYLLALAVIRVLAPGLPRATLGATPPHSPLPQEGGS